MVEIMWGLGHLINLFQMVDFFIALVAHLVS